MNPSRTSASFDLASIGAGLAFADAMTVLRRALDGSPVAVVSAAPGTGKTTLVPPLVANRVEGRVIVTQPRRVAARSAARRLAALDGSPLGDRVGFTIRGEHVLSRSARIEMVTPGVLLRRLLDDPGLDGVGAVILDEIHERALDTDLLLGLLGEVRELRDDLVFLAMSATVDAERFAAILGDAATPAPIVSHASVAHPLDLRWAPSAEARMDERGVTPGFLRHVATVTADAHAALRQADLRADALVFAPGAREVSRIAEQLRTLAPGTDVLELHSQVAAREQDRIIGGRGSSHAPRIIVATSIAESSLTVPGVRLVVDTCLSRVPRRDASRGMTGLVTVPTAQASAVQRAGRAAREAAGTAIRCVDERTFAAAPSFPTPEIRSADLVDAALVLACWGSPGGGGLRLPDPFPAAALAQAQATLRALGATDADDRVTALGRRLGRIPADPRLARALLDGAGVVGARAAAEIVALVAGDIRSDGADLPATLRGLRDGRHPQSRAWSREAERLRRLAGSETPGARREDAVGLVLALAFPERIARRIADVDGGAVFLLASGTRAGLSGALAAEPWIVAVDVTRASGRVAAGTGAAIRSAAPITEDAAERAAEHLLTDRVEATFTEGRLTARRERRLGAILRSSVPVRAAPDDDAVAAVARAIARDGLGLFTWSETARSLRSRLAILHRELGDPWPDVSDTALAATLDVWLAPELRALAKGTPASRIDLAPALQRLLPWPAATRFDQLLPDRLTVPSGSSVRVAYPEDADAQPVVAVKLQECFGLLETPRLVDGRIPVLFHLLSPAGRPLAVTADLASFWAGPYAQVRAEMRGRYPKHPWPEDPLAHVPTAKTKRRLGEG